MHERALSADRALAARDHFWQNIVIETLTTFAALAHEHRTIEGPAEADGRFGLMTRTGQRIPVGKITPMLACSVVSSGDERALSNAVQCSIFQITTPNGEVHTLPAAEIAGFHALTDELVEKLSARVRASGQERDGQPFGFAAFTSLARAERDDEESD